MAKATPPAAPVNFEESPRIIELGERLAARCAELRQQASAPATSNVIQFPQHRSGAVRRVGRPDDDPRIIEPAYLLSEKMDALSLLGRT